jgi:hypothetical protein
MFTPLIWDGSPRRLVGTTSRPPRRSNVVPRRSSAHNPHPYQQLATSPRRSHPAHPRWVGSLSYALEVDLARPPLVPPRGLAPPKGERAGFPRAGGSAPSPPKASTRGGAPSPQGIPNRSGASLAAGPSRAPPVLGPSHPPPAALVSYHPGINSTSLAFAKSTVPSVLR